VRVEEQGRRLQKMFEDQLQASRNNVAGSFMPDGSNVDLVFPATEDDDDNMQLLSVGSSRA
jgi:hypothetical protein